MFINSTMLFFISGLRPARCHVSWEIAVQTMQTQSRNQQRTALAGGRRKFVQGNIQKFPIFIHFITSIKLL